MKKGFVLQSLICLLAVSCSVHEIDKMDPVSAEDDVFFASLEFNSGSDTKVHVDLIDEKVKILWDEKDQLSIFNMTTLNQKYEFMGNTGDNAGYFKNISNESGTGTAVDYVCAVYPYQASTSLDNESGVLTLNIPEEQTYKAGSFGLGANTMVSTTDGTDNLLKFKNVCGYLVLKFYGTNVSVSSIKLEGRNGERLSGEATMIPVVGELPVIEMASADGTSITLKCDKAVKLNKKAAEAIEFWMAVPPTRFTQGFTLTVTDKNGKIFTKETDMDLTIERNGMFRPQAWEVIPEDPLDPNQVIYYTTSDKNTITPAEGTVFGEGLTIVDNKYVDLKGILIFDGDVTQIGDNAFAGCETLTGITIPETVTVIGNSAFAGCTSLGTKNAPAGTNMMAPAKAPSQSGESSIVIPESVTSIGDYAFEGCTSLTSIIIPDGVTSIGAYAFEGCTGLTSVIIPDSVTTIGDLAFANCANLLFIDIPDNVSFMGENVFGGRTGITSVTIPEGTTSIGDYAYAGCENLSEVIIPDTVTSIGDYAFFTCTNLTNISIPSTVRSIGKHAFDDCENLVGITIPDGVTKIEKGTFAACHAFTSIVIPEGVTSIEDEAFDSCSNLTDIELPSTLTSIGSSAFDFCSKLTGIVIPLQVTAIRPNTFEGCTALTSIILPENIVLIDNAAFKECSNLNFITVQAANPPVVKADTFENTNDCPIYVPSESISAYKTADSWSYYVSRIHTIGSPDGEIQGHAYVDMGTGLKWATMNVGATAVDEDGERFVWSAGKAAAENWGGNWRLPTKEEFEILKDESKYTWTWDSTNEGYIVESKIQGYVGNTIFLPTTGFFDPAPESAGTFDYMGCYWSSTPGEDYGSYHLEFQEGEILLYPYVHEVAMGVRPVAD